MIVDTETVPGLSEFVEWYTKTDNAGRSVLAQALANLLNAYSDDFEHLTLTSTVVLTLPAHWSTALFYGDTSGFNDEDQTDYDAFILSHPKHDCVGCSEDKELKLYAGKLTDCYEYTFQILE